MKDSYLLEDHTIRIYGLELKPKFTLVFLTPKIFALEYIIQRLNLESIHFSLGKQNVTFTLLTKVFSFIFKNKFALLVP